MNKSFIKGLVSALLVSFGIILYQNCSQTGFSGADSSGLGSLSNVDGGITSMDQQGNMQGQFTLPQCTSLTECPNDLDVEVYLTDNPSTPVVTTTTTNDGGAPVVYTFTVTVPSQHECAAIIVTVSNGENVIDVQIPLSGNVALWGGACGGSSPLVTIDNVIQEGPMINITGQCLSGNSVDASGAVAPGYDSGIMCTNGTYQFCGMLAGNGNSLEVLLKQILGSQTAQESEMFTLNVPGNIILDVISIVHVNGHARTTVQCLPGAMVEFNIYGSTDAKLQCGDTGELTHDVNLLNVNKRVLSIIQTTPFNVTKTVTIDVDATGVTPSCAIASTSNDNFCGDRSGMVSGSCEAGWPVYLKVDGVLQQVGICNTQGMFSFSKAILGDAAAGSMLSIEQINPLDTSKKCSDSRTLSGF
ncbi:MAG: hypothetical protein KDD33_12545 [Bdellovibrionales bacterium]|nr:hypothetical protein [Bdellovibrionales bacterium]